MITMTVNDLLNIIPVLRELTNRSFKGNIAFKLARIMRELDKESTLFEKAKKKLVEKYGIRDENGNFKFTPEGGFKIKEEFLEECNEEMIDLLNTSIEINADKIPISAFDDIEITPAQVIAIDNLIEY